MKQFYDEGLPSERHDICPKKISFTFLLLKIPSKLEVAPPPKCGLDWMGEWIPLRLLRLLEHLAVLII